LKLASSLSSYHEKCDRTTKRPGLHINFKLSSKLHILSQRLSHNLRELAGNLRQLSGGPPLLADQNASSDSVLSCLEGSSPA